MSSHSRALSSTHDIQAGTALAYNPKDPKYAATARAILFTRRLNGLLSSFSDDTHV